MICTFMANVTRLGVNVQFKVIESHVPTSHNSSPGSSRVQFTFTETIVYGVNGEQLGQEEE